MITKEQIIEALESQSFNYDDFKEIIRAIFKKKFTAENKVASFKIGDKVKWIHKVNPTRTGVVTQLSAKKCIVMSDTGNLWTIPSSMLKSL